MSKQVIMALIGVVVLAGSAFAERFVMITHTQGTDPFWPVVQKGGEDAARAVGARFDYLYAPSGDMSDMAKLIADSAATQPDGMVISLPDAAALGPAIKAAVDSGIPVITMNSGLESSASLGALMHVGQPEKLAGQKAGERAKKEGATNALCLNQEAFNSALVDRCDGYASSVKTKMIDVSNDVAQIQSRTAAALQADSSIDALLAVGPHVCAAAAKAVDEVGSSIHLSCFDLSPEVMDLINSGKVQ
ncbi:MAG: substrate-binding domain-containing protein, partial [SAR324 cluster bacterium]|nr:substrate-binding domain-containing protein [SAR324 cluster bacterium]